jgi:putative endonuclease
MYILRCKNEAYYIGHTDNIDKRMSEHHLGLIDNCYTKKMRPVELIFLQDFSTRDDAFHAERQVKGWSRKKKASINARELGRNTKIKCIAKENMKSALILYPQFPLHSHWGPHRKNEDGD